MIDRLAGSLKCPVLQRPCTHALCFVWYGFIFHFMDAQQNLRAGDRHLYTFALGVFIPKHTEDMKFSCNQLAVWFTVKLLISRKAIYV